MIGTLRPVGIHQEQTHAEYQDDCFLCRASTVSVAPSATPSRNDGDAAARINTKEKEWAKDHRAYRALRAQGVQPRTIDGASRMEAAADKFEVEAGHVFKTKEQRASAREGIERAQQMIAETA